MSGCQKKLYSIRFHTVQPKRYKDKKISVIIRNTGSVNDSYLLVIISIRTHSTYLLIQYKPLISTIVHCFSFDPYN